MNSITLDEALAIIISGKTFSITAVTCDINRKRGGERLVYAEAVVCTKKTRKRYQEYNGVINIRGIKSSEPRAIDPILITKLNGRTVTL